MAQRDIPVPTPPEDDGPVCFPEHAMWLFRDLVNPYYDVEAATEDEQQEWLDFWSRTGGMTPAEIREGRRWPGKDWRGSLWTGMFLWLAGPPWAWKYVMLFASIHYVRPEVVGQALKAKGARITRKPQNQGPRFYENQRMRQGIVYVLGMEGGEEVKVGRTTAPLEVRMKALQTSAPRRLYPIVHWEAREFTEREAHLLVGHARIVNEWFDGNGRQIVLAKARELETATWHGEAQA